MKTGRFSAFLVEDEPLCRADFREILRDFPQIQLVGEADSISTAEKFLSRRPVDLVFLDLFVGRENGLDLLERLPQRPLVIALTAHPQHAARGFELDLVDYVLKPVNQTRLRVALEKARLRKMAAPLQPGHPTFLAELDGKKASFELGEILSAESMGNYLLLHTTRGKAIKRTTFKEFSAKLPPLFFMETGRGRTVAMQSVRAWHRNDGGRLILNLTDNSSVVVAQSHVSDVLHRLENENAF